MQKAQIITCSFLPPALCRVSVAQVLALPVHDVIAVCYTSRIMYQLGSQRVANCEREIANGALMCAFCRVSKRESGIEDGERSIVQQWLSEVSVCLPSLPWCPSRSCRVLASQGSVPRSIRQLPWPLGLGRQRMERIITHHRSVGATWGRGGASVSQVSLPRVSVRPSSASPSNLTWKPPSSRSFPLQLPVAAPGFSVGPAPGAPHRPP